MIRRPGILLVGSFLSDLTGTRSVGEELSLHLSQRGWKTFQTSSQPKRVLRLLDMLLSVFVNRHDYQLAYVEVYSGLAFLWAECVAQLLLLLRKPFLLVLHGGGLVEFSKRNPRRFMNFLNKARVVVTPSRFLQEHLLPYSGSIRYIPNAVDLDLYQFELRRTVTPKVVWLRALHSIYQPDMAVRATAIVMREFENIHITMIGPDKNDGSLSSVQRLIQESQLQTNVSIVGAIPKCEVPLWLARGDIFLNTTRYESFGISVLEAALIGLPIVTTAVGELPYLWQHDQTALLVQPDDASAMADSILRLLNEPGLAEKLSTNARLRAEQFDWSQILPQWESLFQELAGMETL